MYERNNLNFSETSHSHVNTSTNENIESQWVSISQKNCKIKYSLVMCTGPLKDPACTEPLLKRLSSASVQGCITRLLTNEKKY